MYLTVMTFFITSCLSDKQEEEGLAYIDVRKNYPEKEILLTDIADVHYLHLNTDDDDYLYDGWILSITENTIVLNASTDYNLFFSKEGNPKSRFNRRGQGPEEYRNVWQLIYDEKADEVFIVDLGNDFSSILVYNSSGMYKRKIPLPQGARIFNLNELDEHSLFFSDDAIVVKRNRLLYMGQQLPQEDYWIPFYRISKTDGEVLDYLELPGTQQVIGAYFDGRWDAINLFNVPMKCPEGVLIWNAEGDTIYLYKSDKTLIPVIYQTPPVASLNPNEFLAFFIDRGQYQFITVKTLRDNIRPDYAKYYMRYKNTGEVIRLKLLLPEYKGKEFYIGSYKNHKEAYYKNGYFWELDLIELKQAYSENRLSGKLKELVATLNEDEDNNVFMFVDFK